jgi:hypothetical protein
VALAGGVAAASRNLVIARAGADSLHRRWATAADRKFDVLVSAYDKRAMAPDACGLRHVFMPTYKIAGWRCVFERHPDLLQRYDRIAFIDDDIDTTAADINKCFAYGEAFGLSIWQPSLAWSSYFSFAFTLRNPLFKLRYVNFVEMMCPFFTAEALGAAIPLFSLGLETGVDLIWCSLLPEGDKRYAVVDDISVRHTRPVGSRKETNGFFSTTYDDQIYSCLRAFNTRWPSGVVYGGVDRRNREVGNRLVMAAKAAAIAPSVLCGTRRSRVKPIMDHIRHQIFRNPLYVRNARERLQELASRNARIFVAARAPEKRISKLLVGCAFTPGSGEIVTRCAEMAAFAF